MPRARVVPSALSALLLAACGSNGGTPTDARVAIDAGPCWPVPSTPGGAIELGTGDIDFEPLGDTLEIVTSSAQSDPYVQVHSRIHDLPPGDADNLLNPTNPRTKATLVIESLGLTLTGDCPARYGYLPAPGSAAGVFDLIHSLHVGFGFMPIDQVPGQQGRVTIEIVGSDGHYAKAEKLVTIVLPPAASP